MEKDVFRKIKEITITALFSDDDLLDMLVLKGGNALEIIYGIGQRASMDLDFSLETDFNAGSLRLIEDKIKRTLIKTFQNHGYEAFDIFLKERPLKKKKNSKIFWGGYKVEFKIIEMEKGDALKEDINLKRKDSTVIGPNNRRVFTIDISKFEYCGIKEKSELEGLTIYVYSPSLIAIEKLRAICQQMPEYCEIIGSDTASPRARDFFDIYITIEHFKIDITSSENKEMIKMAFAAKEVPLHLLGNIHKFEDYHRIDFDAVKSTVDPAVDLRDFDFYFSYVVNICVKLKSLWVV